MVYQREGRWMGAGRSGERRNCLGYIVCEKIILSV